MQNKVYIETLGCAKNRVDSEIMLGHLLDYDFSFTNDPAVAKVIIVNTCGFLSSAVQESLDRVLDLGAYKTLGKCECLVVAGCMSERYKEGLLEELPEVDGVIGTSDYTQILSMVNQVLNEGERLALFEKRPDYSPKNSEVSRILSTDRHYAYVKIGEGCSNMCSFCNIPVLRGKFRSRMPDKIIKETQILLGQGIKELNLISQDTSSYGVDNGQNLLDLTKGILEGNKQDFWLRIFYSYPNLYPLELFDLMQADSRLVPYADIPFQHINDDVLKGMNRRITRKEMEKILETGRAKVPNLAFRTTMIVGFPGEGEREFQELYDFVAAGHFDHLGVFGYSDEDNILSERMDGKVPQGIIDERVGLIMEAQQAVSLKKNQSLIGQKCKVLVEGESKETELLLQARLPTQAVEVDGVVLINEGEATAGEFAEVEITEAHPYDVVAQIIEP